MANIGRVEACEEDVMVRLPVDLLADIFAFLVSFRDLALASCVCKKWLHGVDLSMLRREKLSFVGCNVDNESSSRFVGLAHNLKELDISRNCWSWKITDKELHELSLAKCISNLTLLSLWGMNRITDKGVILLVSRATSLEHLNIGGTLITDESLCAIADSCPHLKTIVLSSCPHITLDGIATLAKKCNKLEFLVVWGKRIPVEDSIKRLSDSPHLQTKQGVLFSAGRLRL